MDVGLISLHLDNGAGVLADVSYSGPSQVFSMPTYWEFRIWCARGMLTFNYVSPTVTVYAEGQPEPMVYEGLPLRGDYLDEFAAAIENGDRSVTENVLRSTETALTLQRASEKA